MKHSWSVYTAASGEQFCMSRDSCPWAGQKFNENPNIKKLDPDPKNLCISQITKYNNKNCRKTQNKILHSISPFQKIKKDEQLIQKASLYWMFKRLAGYFVTGSNCVCQGSIFCMPREQMCMPGKQICMPGEQLLYACGAILYAQEAI